MIADRILKECGEFGPAQWCLLALFSFVNIFSAFHYFAQTFISLSKNRESFNYNLNYTLMINQTKFHENAGKDAFWLGWEFESLTFELKWFGKDGWKSAHIQSLFFIGSIIGTLVLGILSDKFGRVPMMILANLLAVLGNLLTVYLPLNIWCLSCARFVAGLAVDTNFFMMYIIVMEYIKPSMRTFGLNICIGVWYCVGCLLIPWLAVVTKNWRTFLLSLSGPTLIIPLSCFLVPESAQWLLSIGRVEEALACFKRIAAVNRNKIPENFIDEFRASTKNNQSKDQNGSFLGLFKTPRLRQKTLILIFKKTVLSICYDAMSRNVENLGMDPFTIFTITSASILPSCVVIIYLQDKLGRKVISVAFLLLAGIFNFSQCFSVVLLKNLIYLNVVLGLLGRFSVNVAYNSGTQYAAELIPTQVRGQGLALMHSIGYGATFFSPHILNLANTWLGMPQTILGCLSVTGAVSCLFLPETLNKALPSTLQDAEKFGDDNLNAS